jgi:hypothetical protein
MPEYPNRVGDLLHGELRNAHHVLEEKRTERAKLDREIQALEAKFNELTSVLRSQGYDIRESHDNCFTYLDFDTPRVVRAKKLAREAGDENWGKFLDDPPPQQEVASPA